MRRIGIATRGPQRYRPATKIYKLFWEFNVYDDDPYPSIPHGHSLDKTCYKLDIYDGAVYDTRINKIVGYARPRELDVLWKNRGFQDIVCRAEEYHGVSRSGIKLRQFYITPSSSRNDSIVAILPITFS